MFRPLLLTIMILVLAQQAQAADYYWVGGSGDWSDISHWATTSGGATRHNTVPTANDNVFFDVFSFTGPNQIVNVNNQSIFCLDLNWNTARNTPTFSGPSGSILNIYGSMRLITNMVMDFKGSVNFLATTPGKIISTGTHRFREVIKFNGPGGEWTLQTPLLTDSTLIMNAGSFNANGRTMIAKRWFVNPTAPVTLNLGDNRINIFGSSYKSRLNPQYDTAVIEFNRENLTIIPSASTIELSSPLKPLMRVTGIGNIALGRVFFSRSSGKGRLISEPGGTLTMTKLDLRTDNDVEGSADFDTLALAKGKNYRFEAGFTYRLKTMIALGECVAPIQIFSSTAGTQFTFESSSDSIKGNFVAIQDIKATGGAKFVLRNAVDLGNNSGWDIFTKANNNLYWVGGTGDWNDPAHWSFSSGGAGGACIPTAGENVFFDANSGNNYTVTVNVENAYCRDMSWVGALGLPSFNGTDEKALHIFGSLTFINDMRLEFEGDVYFEGAKSDNVITSAGRTFRRQFIVRGTGTWSLADSLSTLLDFVFVQGNFNTNNQLLFTRSVLSQNPRMRTLTLGRSQWVLRRVDLQNYNTLVWEINPQSMVLDAGTSTIEFRNWYGVLQTTLSGQGPSLNYNQVWFLGGDGSMYTYNRNRQKADSIRCSTSFYLYGRNTMEVLEMLRTSNVIQPTVNDTTTINEILVPDLCTGMVELRSSSPDQKTFLESTHALVVRRMMIKDIFHIGVGPAVANNSIDLGNNQDWTINEIAGRNLYWVGKGGNGDWFDPVNWSLTSGGPGGECIPTAKDNVFFDANSFNGPNQRVNNYSLHAYCRNMSWVGVTNNPVFYMWILNAFGSVDLPKPQIGAYCTNLSLRSNDKDLKLQTLGFQIGSLQIMGHGSWTLQDTLEAYSIIHSEGEFNSNGKPVNINYYTSSGYFANKPILKMGSSHWRINNNGADFNYTASFGSNLTVDAGTSLLEFTNTSPFVYVTNDHTFYNVLFSNPQGTSTWRTEGDFNRIGRAPYTTTFNRLEFRNSGILYGKNVIDSLIFSAGKSYQLDAQQPQTVNEYFQVIGNNCNPIELLSTSQGTKAEVIMNGGKVLADFVQMRDQRGVGSTQFLAGANSTNIGNSNERWVFDAPVDYVDEGILGKDAVLCKNNSLLLDANTFSAGESYRWNDGSSQATLNVNRAGTYFVAVTYNDGCILRDTVRVLPATDFTPNLANDTTLCANQGLVLNADLNLVGATYRWQDGSTATSINASKAGKYKVTIELSGCTASDSTQVRVISPAAINLGRDTSICDGQSLLLDASKSGGGTYLWSDSTSGPTLRITTAGLVWVEVNDGQCTARDSINISVLPALGLNLGRDTSFCEGGSFNLRSNLGNLTYRWQDGSSNASFRASTAGVYWLEASGNGCTERDSVNLRMQALPRFELGPDTSLCDGVNFNLRAMVTTPGITTYRWSNGTTNANISVQSSGVYAVTATLNGCTFNDQRRFTFTPGPAFELGANRGFCIGESNGPSVAVNGGTYRWNTGATTPRIFITQTGLYYVDVTLNGCTKRDSVFYTFAPEPVFTLGRDTILCAGENINLNATTPNATYRWNNGNTTATRNLTQSEVVWADVTVNGCRKRDSIRVQFIDLPKGLLGRDTTLCEGLTKTYQFNVPGATLLWQDNSSANPYVVSTAGLYILRASSGRCSVNDSVQIAYKPYPVFSLGPDTTLCNNETLNLNPTVAGGVYRWNDGQDTAAKMLSQTGTYWLEIDLNACVRRDSVKIVAVNLPQSLLRPDTTLCEGSTLRLSVQVPNTTTQWQDGSSNPAFVVNQAGLYWAQVGAGRCQVRDSISVTYNPLPRFNLGKDTVLCTGETLALGALTGFDQVRWSTGASTPSINVTSAGTYWAQVTQQNCRFSDSLKVTLNAIPTVNLGPDTLVCDDKPFVLQANGSGNAQLLWSDGSTGKSLAATLAGTYWVRASNGRCADTDSMTLSLRECVVFKTFTPNAFSPDGNSTNETFRPYLNENVRVTAYEIQVFDRWGSQAFRSTDINTGWDGFIRGQKAPQGVYIYWFRIEYVDDKGPGNALVRGEVTLMR
jgi:gliding motility-associated-like protein